jgi:hypothetical protein
MRLRRARHLEQVELPGDPLQAALHFAWRIHDRNSEFSGRLDAKASVILSLETALAVVAVAGTKKGNPLSDLRGAALAAFLICIALIAVAIVLAGLVLLPRVFWPWTSRRQSHGDFSFYAGLRRWDPAELRSRLVELGTRGQLDVLAEQLVIMSQVAWRKHLRLQWSVIIAMLALAALLAASALNRIA